MMIFFFSHCLTAPYIDVSDGSVEKYLGVNYLISSVLCFVWNEIWKKNLSVGKSCVLLQTQIEVK
jgi:hypothetical protein